MRLILTMVLLLSSCADRAERMREAEEWDKVFVKKCDERVKALYPGREITVKRPDQYRTLIYEVSAPPCSPMCGRDVGGPVTLYCSCGLYCGDPNVVPMQERKLSNGG